MQSSFVSYGGTQSPEERLLREEGSELSNQSATEATQAKIFSSTEQLIIMAQTHRKDKTLPSMQPVAATTHPFPTPNANPHSVMPGDRVS